MSIATSKPIYTIGHSNLEIGRFMALLKQHNVEAIADVRSSPYSQYNPQFNREQLQRSLHAAGLAYVFLGEELGARRSERECYSKGRADYGLISQAAAFKRGIERVIQGAARMRIALLCAEKDPIDCHRCILVSPELRRLGLQVSHILPDGSLEDHSQTEKRLLELFSLEESDLFLSSQESVANAYKMQGEKVAYHEEDMVLNDSIQRYGD